MVTLGVADPRRCTSTLTWLGDQAWRTLILRIPLILFALFTLFPIYWLARSSFMSEADLIRVPVRFLPLPFSLLNYQEAIRQLNLWTVLFNSVVVAAGTAALSLVLMLASAYALSRFRFRGKGLTLMLLVATQMLPQIMLLVPLFIILRVTGLIDTLFGVIVAELLGAIPFSALLLKQFFDQLTPELDEAAMIDGCNRVQALALIVVPLILPGIVAVTIFNFINVWNAVLLPTILLIDPDNFTLPIALMLLRDRNTAVWGMQAAGGMLNLIPSLILFGIIQRYLISGLASGAVKG
jgi:multiple sugar transport system permease protein